MSFEIPNQEHVEMLKKSAAVVGFLSETLVDKHNTADVLSGKHRKMGIKGWPEREIDVKSPLHRELIILHANIQRQVPEEATKQRLLRIARILSTQGGMLGNGTMIERVAPKDVATKLAEFVPFTERWIRHCLPEEYKHIEFKNKQARTEAEVLPRTVSDKLSDTQKDLLNVFHEKPTSSEKLVEEHLNLEVTLPSPSCKCDAVEVECPECHTKVKVPRCTNFHNCYG